MKKFLFIIGTLLLSSQYIHAKGYCFTGKHKISTVLKTIIPNDKVNYETQCNDYLINFNTKTCFRNFKSFKQYINTFYGYRILENRVKESGVVVNNKYMLDMISFINKKGYGKEIVYIDENIKLKNSNGVVIRRFEDLKNFIKDTTPFYLKKIKETNNKVYYALSYKKLEIGNLPEENSITSLNEVKKIILTNKDYPETKKIKLLKRIDNIIKGLKNYEK